MYGTWLFLDNENQVLLAPILDAKTTILILEAQDYSTDHALGVAYDLWSHSFYQQAQDLVEELIEKYSLAVLNQALALLKTELVNELSETTLEFYELLSRHGITA
jgi:hypothetical protein